MAAVCGLARRFAAYSGWVAGNDDLLLGSQISGVSMTARSSAQWHEPSAYVPAALAMAIRCSASWDAGKLLQDPLMVVTAVGPWMQAAGQRQGCSGAGTVGDNEQG